MALSHAAERHLSEEPAPRGALTFSSSSKVSWQHSQNPLLFLGAAAAVEQGLCSPSLRSRQPSAPLRGNGKGPPWQRRQVPCCLRRAVGRQRCRGAAALRLGLLSPMTRGEWFSGAQDPAGQRLAEELGENPHRSYDLPGSAWVGEAFWRLKGAGAFGCQEIQVRKVFELLMEGSELPGSSRSGHQSCCRDSVVRAAPRAGGSRCCLAYEGTLAITILPRGCSRGFPFLTGSTKPSAQPGH